MSYQFCLALVSCCLFTPADICLSSQYSFRRDNAFMRCSKPCNQGHVSGHIEPPFSSHQRSSARINNTLSFELSVVSSSHLSLILFGDCLVIFTFWSRASILRSRTLHEYSVTEKKARALVTEKKARALGHLRILVRRINFAVEKQA